MTPVARLHHHRLGLSSAQAPRPTKIFGIWDTHGQNFKQLKDRLLPPFDQGLSALLEDLKARGLLDETLVVVVGEFGRTPQINATAGRDHWSGVFSAVFAGAGVRGGQVTGASDAQAAWPATRGWHPADLGATVYSALGIDPGSQIVDRLGRPHRMNAGGLLQMARWLHRDHRVA